MTFNDVIGQQEIKARLRQMVRDDRLPHALMFCGPAGCGKLPLALALASWLLCKRQETTDDCCGECNACHMTQRYEHPDMHFTFPTIKAKWMGTDHKPISDDYIKEWHEMLRRDAYVTPEEWLEAMDAVNQQAIITAGEGDELIRKLSLKSSQGGRKVSIIWLPERMHATCANKMLKLIEEPPLQTHFIFVSESPEQVLGTIQSRVQRIDLKQLADSEIEQALVSRRGIDPDLAHRLARSARGNWNRAIAETQAEGENKQFLEQYKQLMRLAFQSKTRELSAWTEEVASWGRERQLRFLRYILRMTRENFAYNFQQPEIVYMTPDEEQFATRFARFVNERNVIGFSQMANNAMRDIGQNANPKIVFFDMALETAVLLKQ